MKSFNVIYRNYGHWDFCTDEGRAFRLRGSGDCWSAMDERERPYPVTKFKTFSSALLFITETLMHENLIPDGYGNNIVMSVNQDKT